MILRCTCDHEFQDKEHGKKMRVFNRIKQGEKGDTYRCTVCGGSAKGKMMAKDQGLFSEIEYEL